MIDSTSLRTIVNLDGQTCFGCGDNNPIGLHMTFLTDEQRVYSLVTVPPAMAGWDRTVHGGVLSTLLDEIMGWSVIYLLGKIGVTKTMTVEFLKPVQVETQLTVVGTIAETVSERQVVVGGEIHAQDGALCVRATGTFAAMTPQAAVRLGVMSNAYMERFLPVLHQKEQG
ncbi:thioesterase superfamily protein [Desulfobulbus propionicus DSM 2032]|uniref:Thioesterase superfamily protein n=1 Tax=Desulfobulbus propionicus (strain ATCC 33891 / DSM 2032 / VKM B-1956 / 1pr3) TaxID=577650 RepID=A0A7U3YPY8_DESPD|nr:PaaI family thioesterase [Desulfobulbus propionicus]ADW19424.1 thioesterase superfamily protein [Desulfobulbus propionicus DSM 2032]